MQDKMRVVHKCVLGVILLLIRSAVGSGIVNVSIPSIDYSEIGGEIGVLGRFDAVSLYSYVNASSFLSSSSKSGETKLFQVDSSDRSIVVATLNGQVTSIEKLSKTEVLLNGDFTTINDEDVTSPVIFDVDNQKVTPLFSSSKKRNDDKTISGGSVSTVFVDDDLIYMGGDFQFGDSYGLAIYNKSSKELKEAPFKGFGEHSSVNAISKISDKSDSDLGSIVFGGSFDSLGLSDLLKHNLSSHSNHNFTNTSLITSEQTISLKHGTFSNVNGAGGAESSVICPSNGDTYSFADDKGGEWAVELPDEMKGIDPTKVRIYVPQGSDGIKTFRVYSYPNNGIMNLTYIDPETNELAYCDAWCPLSTSDDLEGYSDANLDSIDSLDDDETYIDPKDGSLTRYYDDSTQTKTLGYGKNYQEFAFKDSVAIDKIGITVVGWYGSKGVLGGVEVYTNAITVYGNNSLNDPNCDGENDDNYSRISKGDFVSVQSLTSGVTNTDYLVSTDTNAKLSLYPNVSYTGNYSIIMTTPGCVLDNSCDYRSIVNVSLYEDNDLKATKLIYQNNNEDKFDYLFYGHLKGTENDDSKTRIDVSYSGPIGDSSTQWVVIDKIRADIVSLDDYKDSSKNSSHHSVSKIGYIKLNGLFEYSLANFTDFDEDDVSYKKGDETIISKDNVFVGNSSINQLSGELSKDSNITSIVSVGSSEKRELVVTGNIKAASNDLKLKHKGLIALDVSSYNDTSNQTTISAISKRDKGSSISDLNFNDTISSTVAYGNCLLVLGSFNFESGDLSVDVLDLSKKNDTANSLNNFALYCGDEWYSFGNDYFKTDFNHFTSISVKNDEYFVFSSTSEYKVWDNSKKSWVNSSEYELDVSSSVELGDGQQLISGDSFNVMDHYGIDQAFLKNSKFKSYGLDISEGESVITDSFYVNGTLKVIGGYFRADSYSNLVFVDSDSKNVNVYGLEGVSEWSNNASVQSLAVSNDNEYLFIGCNGTIDLGKSGNYSGLLIYDLHKNSFLDTQPAMLTTNGDSSLSINAIVFNDDMSLVLVGGNFVKAGSLDCVGVCVYDLSKSQWIDPQSNGNSDIEGTVTDIKFYQSKKALLSGNLTSNGSPVNFVTYDFDKQDFASDIKLNNLGSDKSVTRFIMNDESNGDLKGRVTAIGQGFISCFDGSKWHSIDNGISSTSKTSFEDIKLLNLKESKSKNDETYFDDDKILALSGAFELDDYGFVSVALFNSTDWIPYLFSSINNSKVGSVNSILIKDTYNFQSSDDVKSKKLSRGRVVGISLACALGSTTFMGLLYIIPYFALFRKQKKEETNQRIQEKEMMGAVNPEELLHEIDIQRNH